MTRDEFIALYGDFDIGDSETGEQAGASAKFARDLDALLAAARAEAMEEAHGWARDLGHHGLSSFIRSKIRALVKP